LTVSLSATNLFTLSKTSVSGIAAGKTGTFTVVPKTGLSPGFYQATVTVSNANMSARFDVSFIVTKVIKIACVGDSITEGFGVSSSGSYPAQLQKKLGKGYAVVNYGVGSATASSKGNVPYIKSSAHKQLLKSNPDIVIVMLGTNDAKTINWTPALQAIFKSEYKSLAQIYVNLPSHPIVFLVTPIGSIATGSNAVREPNMASQIRPQIREVALESGLPLIEFESILEGVRSRYLSDGYHPSESGNTIMSNAIYNIIT
jgi:lysophospholipase L1-like esterase